MRCPHYSGGNWPDSEIVCKDAGGETEVAGLALSIRPEPWRGENRGVILLWILLEYLIAIPEILLDNLPTRLKYPGI